MRITQAFLLLCLLSLFVEVGSAVEDGVTVGGPPKHFRSGISSGRRGGLCSSLTLEPADNGGNVKSNQALQEQATNPPPAEDKKKPAAREEDSLFLME